MAVTCKVGTLTIPAATAVNGTVAVSGLGFQPTAIIFWWSGRTAASNGIREFHRRGMGFAVSASSFACQATYDTDLVGSVIAKNNAGTDCCVGVIDNLAVFVGKADLQSFDADGFTLEVQDQFPSDLFVSYMAIGGTDNAEIGVFTAAGSAPVNQTVNNAGNFQPDITFFLLGGQSGSGADSRMIFGAASGAGEQGVWWGGNNDTAASGEAGTYCLGSECLAFHTSSPVVSPANRAEFVSHNSGPGGFTINWLERTNSTSIFYLSIKGGLWAVGELLTQTDTTTPIAVTGLGFQPAGLMVVSAAKAESTADAVPDTHDEWSVGAADSASSRTLQQVASRSGNTSMFVFEAARTDAIYQNCNPASSSYSEEGRMDVQSFDSDGFTLIMDDADPSQAFCFYIAVGNPPSGAKGHYYRNLLRRRVA